MYKKQYIKKDKQINQNLLQVHLSLEKKDELHNTDHGLLLETWIVKRSCFHALKIISPQAVPIFAISHLVGCIEY